MKKSDPTFRSRPTNTYSPSVPDLQVRVPTTMAEMYKLKKHKPTFISKTPRHHGKVLGVLADVLLRCLAPEPQLEIVSHH